VTTVIAHDRFAHHGSRSGYVQVLRHLPAEDDVRLLHLPLAPYGARTASEWWRSRSARGGSAPELHLYPEQTLFPRRDGPPVVAVCHQPLETYRRPTPRSALTRVALSRAAGLVALGPEQAEQLTALNPAVDVVPHGVDTDWFSPGEEPADERLCVTVGGWLRNPEQATLVGLAQRGGRVVTEVGGGAPRMSDDAYRDLLRRASAVLLCIPGGVASNAVLEAAACGTPVLGRLSGDLRSYVSSANRDLLDRPLDAQLATPAAELEQVGRENRRHVVAHHEWPDVARQLRSVVARRAPITPKGSDSASPAKTAA